MQHGSAFSMICFFHTGKNRLAALLILITTELIIVLTNHSENSSNHMAGAAARSFAVRGTVHVVRQLLEGLGVLR